MKVYRLTKAGGPGYKSKTFDNIGHFKAAIRQHLGNIEKIEVADAPTWEKLDLEEFTGKTICPRCQHYTDDYGINVGYGEDQKTMLYCYHDGTEPSPYDQKRYGRYRQEAGQK